MRLVMGTKRWKRITLNIQFHDMDSNGIRIRYGCCRLLANGDVRYGELFFKVESHKYIHMYGYMCIGFSYLSVTIRILFEIIRSYSYCIYRVRYMHVHF